MERTAPDGPRESAPMPSASSSSTTSRRSPTWSRPRCATRASRSTTAGDRPRRARRGRGVPARPRGARRDAARPRRLRGRAGGCAPRRDGVPVMFLTARDATEDKVRGPDARRRRLRHEAVQPRGARRPDPRRPAPDRARRRASRAALELRRPRAGRGHATRCWRGGDADRADRRPSSACCATCCSTRGGCCRKAQILDHVWQYDFGGDANVVETYVSYLRKKLDAVGPPLIHTVRGVGYVLPRRRRSERCRCGRGCVLVAGGAGRGRAGGADGVDLSPR